jgi:hypothetical protein
MLYSLIYFILTFSQYSTVTKTLPVDQIETSSLLKNGNADQTLAKKHISEIAQTVFS